ncbi:hypothetical protein ACVC7V_23575 [Hydrogenophaga sp. A37]|uniref:hypothetical protein n=1 Tax=Hydrogenophaga sp. A37 TaxID=1945864 RepID=UPI001C0DBE30|nr:hypothetical protein [Hydrogenophaga sp. A37]
MRSKKAFLGEDRLAALLLVAVLAYGAWEWQQSPKGLIPANAWSQVSSGAGDGDDD